jgi:hypothetical protein
MAEPAPRFTFDEVIERLAGAPGRIAAATGARSEAALLEPLDPGGWSARDVLGHVRACDRTWGAYIAGILDEDQPAFRAASPRSTIRDTDYLDVPFGASLRAFTDDRARLVARLRDAGPDGLARTALVTLAGRGKEERTAFYYADRLADHELEHVQQLERSAGDAP